MTGAPALPQVPTLSLAGKRALVSGAGRGLGVACAATLSAAGAHVTLMARSSREIEEVAGAIRAQGGSADTMACDVTDLEAVARAVSQAEAFDVLVANAGTNRPKPMLETSVEDFDAVLGLNLRASYFLAQAVVRGQVAAGRGGSIIFISSQMGHVGAANRTVYCASKHAVEGLVKALAIELAPHHIRVNSVAPTFIETPMTAPMLADAGFRADVLARIRLGRLGRPEDIMGAVALLAGDAGAMITGTSLRVDGGWTAG